MTCFEACFRYFILQYHFFFLCTQSVEYATSTCIYLILKLFINIIVVAINYAGRYFYEYRSRIPENHLLLETGIICHRIYINHKVAVKTTITELKGCNMDVPDKVNVVKFNYQ